jgi:SP family sugar:H+ symporter-like MFS transporter
LLGVEAWRWMLWAGVIPAVAYGLGTFVIPRSPRFLVSKGFLAEAELVLASLGAGDARTRVREIERTLRSERAGWCARRRGASWRRCSREARIRIAILRWMGAAGFEPATSRV